MLSSSSHYSNADSELLSLRSYLSAETNAELSDDDCRRFLRARLHNLPKTVAMVDNWYTWWTTPLPGLTVTPKHVLDAPDEKEHVYISHLPHANLGEDREGSPIFWEKPGQISANFSVVKTLLSEDEIFVRHVRQQEYMVTRLKKASAKHGKLIEKQVIVFDMKSVSMMADFMALRVFRRTLEVDQACYPERLRKMFLINTPYAFTAIWSLVSPWIDPLTANKIKIVGADFIDVLKQDIAEEQIPVEYGGTRKHFGWAYPHNRDED